MNLCFIGGGNPLIGELDEVMKRIATYVEPESRVLIIPFATEHAKRDGWFQSAKKSFNDIGVENIQLLNDELGNEEMKANISVQDVLYFTGGRPEILMECMVNKGLIQTVKEFKGLMIGVSAGALAFCKDCLITKDEDYPETQILRGLGLVDFSVEVHYEDSVDEELIPLSKERDIYAIPNGGALFWNDEGLTSIKNIFHFSDTKKNKQKKESDS